MSLLERLLKIIIAKIRFRLDESEFHDSMNYEQAYTKNDRRHTHANDSRTRVKIDPEMARYYANLEIPYGADLNTVKQAWKRMVRRYHPDLHSLDPEKQNTANELVKGLNHAYEELVKKLKNKK